MTVEGKAMVEIVCERGLDAEGRSKEGADL